MKINFCSLLLASLIGLFFSFNSNAQQLGDRTVLAHYPLTSDANDATGNFGPIELTNAPLQGADGVNSNGIYLGNDSNGSLVLTPLIPTIDTSDLAISVEFKITEVPTQDAPIIMAGPDWRWLGAEVGYGSELKLAYSGYSSSTPQTISLNTWHTVVLTYNGLSTQFKIYYDGLEVFSATEPLVAPSYDMKISNEHGGTGQTFKGNFRELKVYGPIAVGVRESEVIPFDVSVHNSQGIQVTSSKSLAGVSYNLYSVDGRKVLQKDLPASGFITTKNITRGTHVIGLYRNGKVIGMKKVVLF